jgi:hypothetical protein
MMLSSLAPLLVFVGLFIETSAFGPMASAFVPLVHVPLALPAVSHRISPQLHGHWRMLRKEDEQKDLDLVSAIEQAARSSQHALGPISRFSRSYSPRSYRVTASDVSACGGYEIASAQSALSLLATTVQGAMEVTKDGQIVFVFPNDCRRILRNRRSPQDVLLSQTRVLVSTLTKAVFGVLLLLSYACVRPLVDVTFETTRGRNDDDMVPSLRSEMSCLRASVLNEDETFSRAPTASARSTFSTGLLLQRLCIVKILGHVLFCLLEV